MATKREVIESARIVIKTEAGNRIEVQGKGSAPRLMLHAFPALSHKRREWLLTKMQAEHDRLIVAEMAAARSASAVPLTSCAAGKDGDCIHKLCPQIRDDEPGNSGRHCPLDNSPDNLA